MGLPISQLTMERSGYTQPQTGRWGIALLVAGLHVGAVLLLLRAFAPDLAQQLARPAMAAFDIPVPPPPPAPPPSPPAPVAQEPEGAAAPAGKRARPREVAAPRPVVVLSPRRAPPVAGSGAQDSAGAREAGEGTGAGGVGQGTGAGGSGNGTGTGGGAKAVKIAGDIVSARDYPKVTRALRLGSSVTIALTVDAQGRPGDCRVVRPSRDPEADRTTCRLAQERFRFRPARDAAGQAIPSIYGWQQRWFTPPPN